MPAEDSRIMCRRINECSQLADAAVVFPDHETFSGQTSHITSQQEFTSDTRTTRDNTSITQKTGASSMSYIGKSLQKQ